MNKIIFITGVAGSGKTTIGKLLSQKTGIPFLDADDFHPANNKAKMKAGRPLTDDDRQQWLEQLNKLAVDEMKVKGAIIACSALKEKYRILLAQNISDTAWIFLQGDYQTIYERIKNRKDHFMPPQLLQSQFDSLEIPASALMVDIVKDTDSVMEAILQYLHGRNN